MFMTCMKRHVILPKMKTNKYRNLFHKKTLLKTGGGLIREAGLI